MSYQLYCQFCNAPETLPGSDQTPDPGYTCERCERAYERGRRDEAEAQAGRSACDPVSFGEDHGDSAALERLRCAIDDHLPAFEPESEAGDYDGVVRIAGQELVKMADAFDDLTAKLSAARAELRSQDAGDALERAALQFHEYRTLARNKKRVTVLRREVRRLNAKIAAQALVLRQIGSSDHWNAVRAMASKPVIDGAAMWELRKALGLTACEVSHDDVIRAAARRLAKREGRP